MPTRTPQRDQPKPLLGFGPSGYALLIPLATLVAIAATGYDLRYRLQHLINEFWGWDGLVFFTLNIVYAHAWGSCFWPPLPHFGLASLCIVLLGLHLHPRPVGRSRLALLVALGLLVPVGLFCMYQKNPLFNTANTDAQFALSRLIAGTLVGTALWLATRSARVALLCAAALLAPAALDWASVMAQTEDIPISLHPHIERARAWSGLAMNAALAAILWTWGLRARLRLRPEHCCRSCGYDLRGLGGGPCPECGAPPPDPTGTPRAGPA